MRKLIDEFFRKVKTVEFWKSGNSEIVGFMLVTPVLAFFLVAITGFVQLSMLKTKVDYATYAACRAAAISGEKKTAEENAKGTFQLNLQGVIDYVDVDNLEVEVKPVAHNKITFLKGKRKKYHDRTEKITGISLPKKEENQIEDRKGNGKWIQGEYISCATRCRTKTVSAIANLLKPEITSMQVMLIESKSAPESDLRRSSSSKKNTGTASGGATRATQ